MGKSDMVMEEGFGEDDEGYGLEEFSIADPMEEDFLEDEESYELEDSLEEGYEFKEESYSDARDQQCREAKREIRARERACKREIKAARADIRRRKRERACEADIIRRKEIAA